MLKNVYDNLKTRIGFKDTERELVVNKVNDAWSEIYDSADLPESTDEFIADINVSSQVCTLPWFIDNIRKIRWYDPRLPLEVDAQENRYHEDRGNELWIRKWRKVKREALQRDIDNYTQLTLKFALPETEDVTVVITGETTNSAYTNEEVVFVAGETEKTTVGNFVSVKSISKSKQTKYNLTVSDGDNNTLAIIPNHLFTFKYLTIQILDQVSSSLQQNFSSVEILYKKAFHPVLFDYDEFLWGNKYDMAVMWKYLEQNKNNYTEAEAAQIKCQQILNQIIANESPGIHSKIDFKANPFYGLPYRQIHRAR